MEVPDVDKLVDKLAEKAEYARFIHANEFFIKTKDAIAIVRKYKQLDGQKKKISGRGRG